MILPFWYSSISPCTVFTWYALFTDIVYIGEKLAFRQIILWIAAFIFKEICTLIHAKIVKIICRKLFEHLNSIFLILTVGIDICKCNIDFVFIDGTVNSGHRGNTPLSDFLLGQEFIKIAKLNSILLLADAMDRSL